MLVTVIFRVTFPLLRTNGRREDGALNAFYVALKIECRIALSTRFSVMTKFIIPNTFGEKDGSNVERGEAERQQQSRPSIGKIHHWS